MRQRLDSLLEAPGLTRGRFIALAVVSLIATTVVIAAGLRQDGTPYGLLAAAYSRKPATVEVAAAPRAPVTPAPAAASAPPASASPASSVAPAPAVSSTPAPSITTPAATQTPTNQSKPAPTPAAPVKQPSKIKHVFVVDIATSASYLNDTLKPQGVFLGGYKPLAEGDLASLIALTSGQKPTPQIQQGCPTYGTGCVFGVDTLTLPDQLASKGDTWKAYLEDLGNGPDQAKSCRHPDNGAPDTTAQGRPGDEYATIHNPFVYYSSLTQLGGCQTDDVPFDTLSTDLQDVKTTANFDYIAPNLCHGGWEDPCADGSAGGGAAADAFLQNWVPQILASPAYKADGLLLIVSNQGLLAISQYMPLGAADQTAVDPYSVLRYVEDLFGLDYLGGASSATPLMLSVPTASASASRHRVRRSARR